MVDDSVDLCVVFTVLNNCPEVKVKVTFRQKVQLVDYAAEMTLA
jgi:hypothetical protein